MTDRPIIFSAPMVRALLDGRKTQTRRLLKPSPELFPIDDAGTLCDVGCMQVHGEAVHRIWLGSDRTGVLTTQQVRFGIGDRLYVREHWRADACYDDLSPSSMGGEEGVRYEADGAFGSSTFGPRNPGRHRQGMHMPRWASRLTLTLTDVRVQRLQEISEADARAEGVKPTGWEGSDVPCHCRIAFRDLWNSLHRKADERWEDNPWIYALTFSVEQRNIDQ